MARRELSQDPRAVKTRNAIIKTTTELLNEHRVEDITVSQIVNAAGMSRQVFYEHFKDRDAAVTMSCSIGISGVVKQAISVAWAGPLITWLKRQRTSASCENSASSAGGISPVFLYVSM